MKDEEWRVETVRPAARKAIRTMKSRLSGMILLCVSNACVSNALCFERLCFERLVRRVNVADRATRESDPAIQRKRS